MGLVDSNGYLTYTLNIWNFVVYSKICQESALKEKLESGPVHWSEDDAA
jgi:hypothetical protein